MTDDAPKSGVLFRPVYQAISKVMGEVGSVKKEGFNDFHRYKYAAAADVMHALQPVLSKHGLSVIQHQKNLSFIQDGAAMAIEYEFYVVHSSGDKLDFAPVHTGVAAAKTKTGSPDDKAANKCHTAARKYFLLSLFQIPTGDYVDADADGDVPEVKATKQKEIDRATKTTADAPKSPATTAAGGIFLALDKNGAGSVHGSVTAYLDALEGALSRADDPNALFDLNEATLQQQQAKAAKAKGNPAAEAIVGRIAAIFAHVHAGTVPGLAA
jgi:hypothetical protein